MPLSLPPPQPPPPPSAKHALDAKLRAILEKREKLRRGVLRSLLVVFVSNSFSPMDGWMPTISPPAVFQRCNGGGGGGGGEGGLLEPGSLITRLF